MKTTQDLHILMNQVANSLSLDLVSVEQFSDKSFAIHGYTTEVSNILYNSDEAIDGLDINDLPYLGPDQVINIIKVYDAKLVDDRQVKEVVQEGFTREQQEELARKSAERLQALRDKKAKPSLPLLNPLDNL